MRKFSLQNAIGERWSLNGKTGGDKLFFSLPSGLGYQRNPVYANLGAGFYQNVQNKNEEQTPLQGTIIFYGAQPYASYREFINWINKSYELNVVYCPFGQSEFLKTVDINVIEKGERERHGWLEVPLVAYPKTPWFIATPRQHNIEPQKIEGTTIFTFRYGDRFTLSTRSFSIEVRAQGHIPAAVYVTLEGTLHHPTISLFDMATLQVYGECNIARSIGPGQKLIYSTLKGGTGVWLIDEWGEKHNLIDEIKLSASNFFSIPVGKTCVLGVAADDITTASANMKIFDYYRSV